MQIPEFTVVLGFDHESGFHSWVKQVLKKRSRIFASIRKWQTRYLKRSNTFGIKLIKTDEQAYALDAKNGNTFMSG